MNKCFVKQFAREVDNDDVPFYGAIRFKVNVISSGYSIKLTKATGGLTTFTTLNSELYKDKELDVSDSQEDIGGFLNMSVIGLMDCLIKDKYNLSHFNVNSNLQYLDISDFLECGKLRRIIACTESSSTAKGDVKKFLTDHAALFPNRESLMISVSDGGFTNIPTGVGNQWNNPGEVFFDPNYTDGWYIKASNGTYYDSNGNVITP